MKALIAVLIFLAFIQTTLTSLDLVLMLILIRAYIKVESSNFYLAFFLGLLVAFLDHLPIGMVSVIYLLLVFAMHILTRAPIRKNLFFILPIMLLMLTINKVLIAFLMNQTVILWPKILIEVVLVLPLYLILRIWEERFIVKSNIRLKI